MARPQRLVTIAAIAVAMLAAAVGYGAGDGWADLAGPLRSLAAAAEGGQAVGAKAVTAGLQVAPDGIVVTVYGRRGPVPAGKLQAAGARVLRTLGRKTEAVVPGSALRRVAALPEVALVAPAARVFPLQFGYGATVSEGVQRTNASAFQINGIDGAGAKVAIIDVGFANWAGAEIPAGLVTTQTFRADGTMGAGDHGTAVAEVVADMAPGAELLLIAVDTPGSVVDALQYAVSQGCDVACVALGILEGPFDGTHEVAQAVTAARAAGCFVVVAAGNFAQRHWQGPFTDMDTDGWCEFAGADETISVTLPADGILEVYLSWYETAGPTTDQDYDIVITDGLGNEVARSAYVQNGDDPPSERLVAYLTAGTYDIRIQAVNAAGMDSFQLFVPMYDIEPAHQIADRSLSIPAGAQGAFVVGAARGSTIDISGLGLPNLPIDTLEPWSSCGPSVGGYTRPDLLAPDVVSTSLSGGVGLEQLNPFIGTSAAAAHVAGAAALLVSEDSGRGPDELAASLTQLAYTYWKLPILLGGMPPTGMTFGQDNYYGWGRLTLRVGTETDSTPPEITFVYPQAGETVRTRTPNIIVAIRDQGSGIDAATIQLWIDGAPQVGFTFTFDPGAGNQQGTLTYTTPSLMTGTHSLSVQVADVAGNLSAVETITFMVVPPSIASGLQMVTLPYKNVTNPDPSSIFIPPTPGTVTLWRWVPSDTAANKYHVYPDPWASLTPPDCTGPNAIVATPPAGLGYFVYTPGVGTTWIDCHGETLQTIVSYTIRLLRGSSYPLGWNMIGNPFTAAVQWGGVEFVTDGVRQDLPEAVEAGVTEGVLFEFVNTGTDMYYQFSQNPLAAIMEPFKGYWVHVTKDTELVIYSPGVGGASVAQKDVWSAPAGQGWRLQLVAEGAGYDPTTYIGVQEGCSDGYDAGRDIPKPPPVAGALQVYLPKDNWGEHSGAYAQDIRGRAAGQVWEIEVVCRKPNAEVRISWPRLNEQVPKDVRLVIEDVEGGREVYMRTSPCLTFNSGPGGVRHLRVRVLEEGERVLQVRALAAKQVGRAVTVSFALTSAADVVVEVRNISGRLVRRIAVGQVDGAKAQTVMWNLTSDSGAPVPAGRYLICVTARTDDGQVVQGIRAVQVRR